MSHPPNSSQLVKVSVVIPVYNEGLVLERLLPKIVNQLTEFAGSDWEILIVDDGSTDGCFEMAKGERVKLLRHGERRGSGAARKTGSKAANGTFIAWIDGDGTYEAQSLVAGMREVQNADQVVGIRSVDYGHLRFVRQAVKYSTSRFAGWLWKTWIPDLNSGMRIFRRQCLLVWIDELPDGFSCTSTATLASLNHKQRVSFFPISYYPRSGLSSSKFHPLTDTLRLWRAVWRCWLRR